MCIEYVYKLSIHVPALLLLARFLLLALLLHVLTHLLLKEPWV